MKSTTEIAKKVTALVGQIGKTNLSTNASKRIADFNASLGTIKNLEKAVADAEEGDEKTQAEEILSSTIDELIVDGNTLVEFLTDELADVEAKREDFRAKQEEAEKKRKEKEEEERKRKEAEGNNPPAPAQTGEPTPAPTGDPAPAKKSNGILFAVGGTLLLLATAGIVNMWKNR